MHAAEAVGSPGMEMALLYFDGFSNWGGRRLSPRGARPGWADRRHRGAPLDPPPEDSEASQFRGSPTVVVDVLDPFADPSSPVGLACRL